jgi:hypothetical protein
VHDERNISGFPDAGGFPELRPLYSRTPERLVRDLTLRVRLRGENVARNAGAIEFGLATLGTPETSDPLGSVVKPLVAKIPLEVGDACARPLRRPREIKAADGFFIDDFRGQDLYQRFGGGPTTGYGDTPVALRIYEIGERGSEPRRRSQSQPRTLRSMSR